MNVKHYLLYGIFGALTTFLAWGLYWLFTRITGLRPVTASALAWFLAVIFAYATNRKWVFHSHSDNIIREFISFTFSRLGTGIFDLAVTWLFVEYLGFYDMPVKIISNILVIIMNYVASRIIVFKGE